MDHLIAHCACGETFQVTPEHADGSGECRKCQAPISIPSAAAIRRHLGREVTLDELATLRGGRSLFEIQAEASGETEQPAPKPKRKTRKPKDDTERPQSARETTRPTSETSTGSTQAKRERPAKNASDLASNLGRFEIRSELGAGAFGTVYRAYDPMLDREVALKVPQAHVAERKKPRIRFLREAKAAAQLTHPNIVPIYDTGEDGKHLFIASKFIDGQTLDAAIENGSIGYMQAASILQQLADALAYAHDQGVVHRDLKPANIMLDGQGRPHVMDFGLARLADEQEKVSREGAVVGTPAYMSPEQASGESLGTVGPQSDQYSLGAILYELLTEKTPYQGSIQVVVSSVANPDVVPPNPRKLKADIPRDLEVICLKAMEFESDRRYSNCQSLSSDIRRWEEDRPILARRAGPFERLTKWARRSPAVASLLTLSIAGLVVMLAGSQWYNAKLQKAFGDLEQTHTELETANDDLTDANSSLETAIQESESNLHSARDAIDDLLEVIRDDKFANIPGAHGLQNELTTTVVNRYEGLTAKYPKNSDLRAGLARAQLAHATVLSQVGSSEETLEQLQLVEAEQRKLLADSPGDTKLQADLAATLKQRGMVFWADSMYGDARLPAKESHDLFEQLVEADESNAKLTQELASTLNLLGNISLTDEDSLAHFKESHRLYAKLIARFPNNASYQLGLAAPLHNISRLHVRKEDYDAALESIDESRAAHSKATASGFRSSKSQSDLALGYCQKSLILRKLERMDDAMEAIVQGVEVQRDVVLDSPDVHRYSALLATVLRAKAELHWYAKEFSDVKHTIDESIEALNSSAKRHPKSPFAARELLTAYVDISELYKDGGIGTEGSKTFDSSLENDALDVAIEHGRTLCDEFSGDRPLQYQLAKALFRRGSLASQTTELDQAMALYDEGLTVYQTRLLTTSSGKLDDSKLYDYLLCTSHAVEIARKAGASQRALVLIDTAIPEGRKSSDREARVILATLMNNQASVLREDGRLDESIAILKECLSIREPLLEVDPWHWWLRSGVAGCYINLAAIYHEQHDTKSDLAAFAKYMDVWGRPRHNWSYEGILGKPAATTREDAETIHAYIAKGGSMKRFTIPVQFNARTSPFDVYITYTPVGKDPLEDQARWLLEVHGGVIPEDVRESFRKIHALAVKKNVSFLDLAVYALENAEKEKAAEAAASKSPSNPTSE